MGGHLGGCPFAPLSYTPTVWRLVALCALALMLIPTSLAQNFQLITPTFAPSDGWHDFPGAMVSTGSSDNYSAKFSVDSNAWGQVIISAGVITKHGDSGEVALFEDGQQVLTFQGGVTRDIPEGGNHNYSYTIKATSGSSDSIISVSQVIVNGVHSSTTQIGTSIPAVTLPGTQISSTRPVISGAAIAVIAISSTSVISTTRSTSPTTIPVVTTTSPTISTGLPSPPAFTNSPTSISDASLVSSDSKAPGPNSGAVVGAVFGILVGITLCIFAGILYCQRRVRNRVAPSTAFMNYRSATEQPPAYPFNRTSFFQRSKAGLASLGGLGDSNPASPCPFYPGVAVAGFGYGGAGGRRLMAPDEKSTEGRDSPMTASIIAPSHEDPHSAVVSYQGKGGMGIGGGDIDGGSLGGAGAGAYGAVASRGLSIDVARKLTPPPSTTSDKFASTPSFLDKNPHDGLATPEPAVNSHADPFRTPLANDILAGRGARVRA